MLNLIRKFKVPKSIVVLPLLLITANTALITRHVLARNTAVANNDEVRSIITEQCPNISQDAIRTSLVAFDKARDLGVDHKNIITIVDYTQPSNEQRFCTVNLEDQEVVFNTLVSHGVASGQRQALRFSNVVGSKQSMLGLYLTGKTYYGKSGYSLQLHGLDKGFNDNAEARHVVVHGTPHVNEQIAKRKKRVGNSLGCFGLNNKIADDVIDTIKDGTLLYAYYPSEQLTHRSMFLKDTEIASARAHELSKQV